MSLAGPIVNITTAFLAGLLIRYLFLPFEIYQGVLVYMLIMNIGLGLFNLLPIPPLDGSHVLENILPHRASQKFREVGRYGPMVILGIVLLDNFAHTGIMARLFVGPMKYLAHLFSGINF